MEAFLLKLLNMSLTGSSVILVVLLARLVLRRAPRAVSYALWAVPFLRLALPFSFESVYSLVRVRPDAIPPDIVYAAQPAIDSGVQPLDAVVNAALTAAVLSGKITHQKRLPLAPYLCGAGLVTILLMEAFQC